MKYGWLVFACVFSLSAAANVPPAEGPHGATEEQVEPGPGSIGIELYGWSYSSPFTDLSKSPLQLTNQLTVHTPAFGPFDWEITPQFILQPFQGDRFQLLDPSVGVEGTVFEQGAFTYWARYEALLPLSYTSRQEGLIVAPQAMQSVELRLPGTRLKSEIWVIPTLKIFQQQAPSLALYLSPRLIYSLSDSFSLISLLEYSLATEAGKQLLSLTRSGDWSLGFGFRYASSNGEGLWIHPFWNFYPEGTLASSSHLGLFFGGPLL